MPTSSPNACLMARAKGRLGAGDRQADGRCADPLSAQRPDQHHPARNGQDGPRRRHRALSAAQDQDRRDQGRSALQLHVLGHAGRRHDGRASSSASSACPATASRSRSSTCRACRPKSPRWWSRCSAGWCSISRSGRATSRSARSCSSARRRIATFPTRRNAEGSSVGRILSRIAKEGRKYGVSLGLITQRPSDLAEGVLSQCGTIISMRLNNDRDQAFVRAAMPEGARGFLDSIPALRNRECIICGEGVADPDPRRVRHARRSEAPGLGRSALLRAVARRRRRGCDHRPHDQALARAGPLRRLPISADSRDDASPAGHARKRDERR